jgi:hypothetical protein
LVVFRVFPASCLQVLTARPCSLYCIVLYCLVLFCFVLGMDALLGIVPP